MSRILIGDRVHDRISGFAGLTTGRLEYLNGCRQFLVKPEKLDKDGKIIEGMWIDEQTLVVDTSQVEQDPFAAEQDAKIAPTVGGPDRPEHSL